MLLVSKDGHNPGLAVKTLNPEHQFYSIYKLSLLYKFFLSKYFKKRLHINPSIKIKDLKNVVEEELMLVTMSIYKSAKEIVIQELNGSHKAEFAYFDAYAVVLKRSNSGSKAETKLCKGSLKEERRVFSRIFICLNALTKGWMAGWL